MSNPETAVAPKAKKASDIFKSPSLTKAFQDAMAVVLPKHISSDRMAKVALVCIRKIPKLQDCTPESFMNCMIKCSEIGLEPDGELAHLIPYGKECTLIVDYKGYVDLIRRSGEVDVVKAFTIREHDKFAWKNGKIEHEISLGSERGKTIGVYTYIKYSSGAEEYGEPMSREEVEKIRKISKAANSGPWKDHWDEMAKKTAIKRDRKMWPRSPHLQMALQADFDRADPIDITKDIKFDDRLDDIDSAGEEQKPAQTKKTSKKKDQPKETPPAADPAPEPSQEGMDLNKPIDTMDRAELTAFIQRIKGNISDDQAPEFVELVDETLEMEDGINKLADVGVSNLTNLAIELDSKYGK